MDDLQTQIDTINAQMENDEQDFSDFSDQYDSDTSDQSDINDDIESRMQDVEQSSGQLTAPLTQDSIDAISEQAPSILSWLNNNGYMDTAVLVSGTITITNPIITANSLVLVAVVTKGGTQGILSYTTTAGSLVINSSSSTDTSTVVYIILVP